MIKVTKKPKVAVLATGDEVIDVDAVLEDIKKKKAIKYFLRGKDILGRRTLSDKDYRTSGFGDS